MPEDEGSLEDEVLGLARSQASGSMEDEVLELARKRTMEDEVLELARDASKAQPAKAYLNDTLETCLRLASEAAEKAKTGEPRARAYSWISSLHLVRRDFDLALQSTGKMVHPKTRPKNEHAYLDQFNRYSQIASKQFEAGLIDESRETFGLAAQTCSLFTDKERKCFSYTELASAQSKAGMNDEAKQSFDLALKLMGEMTSEVVPKEIRFYMHEVEEVFFVEHEHIASFYRYIASKQFEAGMVDEGKGTLGLALQTAEKIENPMGQLNAYIGLASYQAGIGMTNEAKQTFALAFQAAEREAPVLRSYSRLISAQFESKMPDEARKTIESALKSTGEMHDGTVKAKIYSRIAKTQLELEMPDQAKQTLDLAVRVLQNGPEFYFEIGSVFSEIAEMYVELGMNEKARESFESAIKFTGEMPEKVRNTPTGALHKKLSVYTKIASAQAKAGMSDEAKEAFGLALDLSQRFPDDMSTQYNTVATSQIEAGMYSEALGSIGKIADPYIRFHLYLSMVANQVKAELIEEAKKTLGLAVQSESQMPDDIKHKIEANSQIARNYMGLGKFKEAEETAQKLPDNHYYKSSIFSDMAKIHLKADRLEEAKHVAEKIPSQQVQSGVYFSDFIPKQLGAGNVTEALNIAGWIKSEDYKSMAYTRIATACHKALQEAA